MSDERLEVDQTPPDQIDGEVIYPWTVLSSVTQYHLILTLNTPRMFSSLFATKSIGTLVYIDGFPISASGLAIYVTDHRNVPG